MSATREQILENVKGTLDQLLDEIKSMKMSVCVLLTYVEQELEKKEG